MNPHLSNLKFDGTFYHFTETNIGAQYRTSNFVTFTRWDILGNYWRLISVNTATANKIKSAFDKARML